MLPTPQITTIAVSAKSDTVNHEAAGIVEAQTLGSGSLSVTLALGGKSNIATAQINAKVAAGVGTNAAQTEDTRIVAKQSPTQPDRESLLTLTVGFETSGDVKAAGSSASADTTTSLHSSIAAAGSLHVGIDVKASDGASPQDAKSASSQADIEERGLQRLLSVDTEVYTKTQRRGTNESTTADRSLHLELQGLNQSSSEQTTDGTLDPNVATVI